MVRRNEYLLSLCPNNNFPLSITTKATIDDRINAAYLGGEPIYILPGGGPTHNAKLEDAAAIIHNMRLDVLSQAEWRIYGDVEILRTPNGLLLETIDFNELQFWLRGTVLHGIGMNELMFVSFTLKATAKNPNLSFKLVV